MESKKLLPKYQIDNYKKIKMDKQTLYKTAQDMCINLNGLYGLQQFEEEQGIPQQEYTGGGLFQGGYIGGRMGRMRMMGRRFSGGYFRQSANGRWYEKKAKRYGYGDLPAGDRRLNNGWVRNSNNAPAAWTSRQAHANSPWQQILREGFGLHAGKWSPDRATRNQQFAVIMRQISNEYHKRLGTQARPRAPRAHRRFMPYRGAMASAPGFPMARGTPAVFGFRNQPQQQQWGFNQPPPYSPGIPMGIPPGYYQQT